MSTQSIYRLTNRSVLEKVDKFYICQGDKYIIKDDYDIDKGLDIYKFVLVQWLDDVLNKCHDFDHLKILEKVNKIV